jgi:hypothetical protein
VIAKRRGIMRSFLFVALVSLAACGTQQVDGTDQLDAPAGKEDAAAKPAGAYTNMGAVHAGQLATLSLNADHTFTATVQVECIAAPCNPVAESGTFLFTHGTTKHYIRLYAEDGTSIDRYTWELTSRGQLKLTADGSDSSFTMARGGSCEAAGGTCTALVPDACQAGSIGDATEYSCGGGLGVECCLPAQADNSCQADTDCSGILPQFCRQCSDGSSSCAHWSCVANACQIATCN